jgi:hypothetical protein
MPHPEYKGQPLPVYSICPNWKTKVSLRTIYSTLIRESLDLSEVRIAKQPRCLYALRYSTLPLTGQETGYIRRVLEMAQALPIIMPVWTEASKLTTAAGVGDNILQVDTTFPTLLSVLYDYVIVWKDFAHWEIVATDNPGTNEITLDDEIQNAYPVGSLVMPILIGKMPRPATPQITDEHGTHSVNFEERFHGLTDQSVVEQILPDLELSYTDACRAEFVITARDLDPETVYSIEISDDPAGDWAPHIYFALTEALEIATGVKEIVVNNDYAGAAYFRIARALDAAGDPDYEILTRHAAPLASVVAPPVISLTNLSEITTEVQLTAIEGALAGASDGLRSLEYYSDGGFIIPYSAVEDPLSFGSLQYRRFQKQYAGRQWSTSSKGTLLAGGSINNVVSTIGPAGATIKWTRDLSDPALDTPAPLSYNGVANNAYVWDDKFTGVIKARCFKDGCRSPLAMVAVTKVMFEHPVFKTQGMSRDAASYCDLPDPVDGSESGLSCNLNYGGICGFEAVNYAAGTSGGVLANGGDLLQSYSDSIANSTFMGWPVHSAHSSYYQFAASTWAAWFNGWLIAPVTHSWAITTLGVIEPGVEVWLTGASEALRDAWTPIRDAYIDDLLPGNPGHACGDSSTYEMRMTRFDITRSPLYYMEMRDLHWLAPTFDPPADSGDPAPVIPPAIPYDDFETYTEGTVATLTLGFHDTVDWDGYWTVRDGATIATGFDKFDDYADGAVPDYTATPAPGYDPYDGGEAWDPGDEWRRRDGELSKFYIESWDGIADGALPFDTATAGTGFMTGLGEGWVFGGSLTFAGVDSFDAYADGAFVPAATGTNMVAGEAWVQKDHTVWYVRILQQGITNPVGNNIGITEFEAREVALGTNWALASNGGVALASTEFSGTYAASKAIDGDSSGANNGWANNGTGGNNVTYLRVKFAAPRTIRQYKVGHYPTGGPYPALSAWDFQYSYDGTIWMGTSSVTGQTVWTLGELKTISDPF